MAGLLRTPGAKHCKSLRFEERLGPIRLDIPKERCCIGVGGTGRQSDGIDDRWVRVLGEGADDLDVGVGCGIGLIDNPGRGLTARNEQQGGAHVLSLRDLARHAGPDAELLQGGLAVLAGGNGIDVGHRQPPVADNLCEVESRP